MNKRYFFVSYCITYTAASMRERSFGQSVYSTEGTYIPLRKLIKDLRRGVPAQIVASVTVLNIIELSEKDYKEFTE